LDVSKFDGLSTRFIIILNPLSMNEFVDTGQEAIRTADGTAEVDERVSTVGHKLYRCQGEIYLGRCVVREYTRKLTIQEEDEPNS